MLIDQKIIIFFGKKNAQKSAFELKYLEIYQLFVDSAFFSRFSTHKSFDFDHQNQNLEKKIKICKFFIKILFIILIKKNN